MAAGAVAEQVAVELETVAGDLETVANVTRRLDGRVISSFGVGVGIGVAIGFYVGYRYSKKKLTSEIYAEADQEIAQMRELYEQKIMSVEAQDKPPVSEVVQDLGYSSNVNETELEAEVRPLRPPVPVTSSRRSVSTDKSDDWDWETEIENRDPSVPFVIHQDEHSLNESGYGQVEYMYYTVDDILVDESDPQTILQNRENLIGNTLALFGHGSDDSNTVYVRNSELELEFEIHRVDLSWAEEVLGHNPNESG